MVDKYTKVKQAYFEKRKGDTFKSFKTFNTIVKNQTGHLVKRIRLHNRREYSGNTFLEYYKEEGIIVETTVTYIPK